MSGQSERPSFGEMIFDHCSKYFGRLISKEILGKTKALLHPFPNDMSSFWGYELHLKSDHPATDLLFCVHKRRYLNDLISGQKTDWNVELPFPNFEELTVEWKGRTEFISNSISNLWFEIDEKDLSSGRCDSSFFFAPQAGLGPLGIVDIANEVYRRANDPPGFNDSLRTLFELANFIDGQAEIVQIGQMRSRGESGFRLFIQGMNRGLMQSVLEKFDYEEMELSKLWRLWDDIELNAGRAEVNLDIGSAMGSKIGLEAYFETWDKAQAFLNTQVTQKRATDMAARALINDVEGFGGTNGKLQPFFSHFKVNYAPSQEEYLKAYIAFNDTRNTPMVTRTHH